MRNLAVVGAQWGDEGKGKIVDLLSERFDVVARFQGGPNAGHTVRIGERTYALHHVPSGVFRPDVRIVVGNGTVLDLGKLLTELDDLAAADIRIDDRLFISERAHVILPLLKRVEALAEASAEAADRIGTTLRGIGPTYEAKAARWGVRMADLADPDHVERRLRGVLDGPTGRRLREAGVEPGDPAAEAAEAHAQWQRLSRHVVDTAALLNDWIDDGLSALFEGAQGTLLDLDHGSYPFVTSSSTVVGGVCSGLGVSPRLITGAVGVFKAYCTRVGAGPMATELDDGPDGDGERLRQRGREFGTTTGRPRRCGWFDGVAARYANRINRFDGVCVTLLDVLDTFDEIRICTGYRLDGRLLDGMPASVTVTKRVEPVYETLAGWDADTTRIRRWQDLPDAARRFVERLGEVIGAPVDLVGVGPERTQSLLRPGSWLASQIER